MGTPPFQRSAITLEVMIKEELRMSTYNIEIAGDTLTVGFGNEPANNDRIVIEASQQLEKLIATKQIRGGELLKITGRQSVPVTYAICHKVAHLYGAIAVFDPKTGGKGFDEYVIAISHSPNYHVGQVLKDPQNSAVSPVKVVLCGPPRSGKSCLREGLKIAIEKQMGQAPYILTACPDGEGAWFYESYSNDSKRALELKKNNNSEFSTAFAECAANWVRDLSIPALIDCGGKMSEENDKILKEATHAIVIAGDRLDDSGDTIRDSYQERLDEWSKYCSGLNLTIIAEVRSDLSVDEDRIDRTEALVLTGVVHKLNRGEDVSSRPMIQALANRVVKLMSIS
jgi:CRISPR-associated protein Csx3